MASRLLILPVLVVLLGAGCASARRGIGDNVTVPKIAEIIPGKTTRAEVRTTFGKPDLVKDIGEGVEEYTYIQGKNDAVSWLVLSGYLVYNPMNAFSGNRILIVRFDGETVSRFVASDGKMLLKKGFKEKARETGSEENR